MPDDHETILMNSLCAATFEMLRYLASHTANEQERDQMQQAMQVVIRILRRRHNEP